VTDALATRISCRAYLDQPVDATTLRSILDAARHAPSGGNLQPWWVYALTGAPLAEFKDIMRAKVDPRGEASHDYEIYPASLGEPYRSRRYKCGEDLYATIGIARDDKPARLRQLARNYEFFGAPVGLFFCIDRAMGTPQWSDLGMYMQSLMLVAREHGLHTCAQEIWSLWPRTVGDYLHVPPNLMLFAGMALGYGDSSHPVNTLRTDRAPLEDFASLRGFEDR
jgi:nitroreductase